MQQHLYYNLKFNNNADNETLQLFKPVVLNQGAAAHKGAVM